MSAEKYLAHFSEGEKDFHYNVSSLGREVLETNSHIRKLHVFDKQELGSTAMVKLL